MKKLIYVFVAMLLIVACESKPTESGTYDVKIVNKSGGDFSIVVFSHDSLVLERTYILNGSEYSWSVDKGAKYPFLENGPGRAVIFFSIRELSYEGSAIQDDMDPRWFENYERIEKDGNVTYQYTLTKEQYDKVVDKYAPKMVNRKCVMVNKSGVNVVFETKVEDERVSFPEKLELLTDATFEWSFESISFAPQVKTSYPDPIPVPFGSEIPEISKVTFADNVEVLYDGLWSKDRDPRFEGNYVKEVIDRTHEVYTYTFTEEDYQKAQQ